MHTRWDQEANLQGLCNQKRASKTTRLRGGDRLQFQLPGKLRLEDSLSHGIGGLIGNLDSFFSRGRRLGLRDRQGGVQERP